MGDIVEKVLSTVLSSVVFAAISAVAFIAYKHPKAYQRLWLVLMIMLAPLSWSCLVWQLCIIFAESMFVRSGLVPRDKVYDTLDAIQIPLWLLILNGAAISYLTLLWTLPYWLLEKEPEQGDRQTQR